MTTVQHLEQTIARLPPEELSEFRRWFADFDAAVWDARIEADAATGRLDAFAHEALVEYQAGQASQIIRSAEHDSEP